MRQRLQVARRPGSALEPLLVPVGATAHLLDVGLGLGQRPARIAHGGLGIDPGAVEILGPAAHLGQGREAGMAAPLVRELGQPGVERLHIE